MRKKGMKVKEKKEENDKDKRWLRYARKKGNRKG